MQSSGGRTDTERESLLRKASAGETVKLEVKKLLELWGAERRSPDVVRQIRSDLHHRNLTTEPPFTEVWIGSEVSLVPRPAGEAPPEPADGDEDEEYDLPTASSLQIKALPQANKHVECVHVDVPIPNVVTTMTHSDYSQLGVIDGDGRLIGAISERSIAQAAVRGSLGTVKEAYDDTIRHLRPEALLFDVEGEIRSTGFGIVCSPDGRPCGIITSADLAEEFASRLFPLMTIESIELRVRKRVLSRFTREQLQAANAIPKHRNSSDVPTLGAYRRLLDGAHWAKLDWRISKSYFLKMIKKTTDMRNHLAHFSPDPPNESELTEVTRFEATLRKLT
nr:hypothetical protein GCM10025732_50540 [Glycomyces mayteni]